MYYLRLLGGERHPLQIGSFQALQPPGDLLNLSSASMAQQRLPTVSRYSSVLRYNDTLRYNDMLRYNAALRYSNASSRYKHYQSAVSFESILTCQRYNAVSRFQYRFEYNTSSSKSIARVRVMQAVLRKRLRHVQPVNLRVPSTTILVGLCYFIDLFL